MWTINLLFIRILYSEIASGVWLQFLFLLSRSLLRGFLQGEPQRLVLPL
jgi:hypothetical protein